MALEDLAKENSTGVAGLNKTESENREATNFAASGFCPNKNDAGLSSLAIGGFAKEKGDAADVPFSFGFAKVNIGGFASVALALDPIEVGEAVVSFDDRDKLPISAPNPKGLVVEEIDVLNNGSRTTKRTSLLT